MEILIVIVFFVLLILIGVAGGLLYLLYLPIKKRLIKNGKLTKYRSRQVNIAYIVVLGLFSIYQICDAFFPGWSFYEQEFKTVTLREIPKSATFIQKTSSYPDFRGDYCSSSQIRLSKEDYKKLLSELSLDRRFTKDADIINSPEFNKSLAEKSSEKIVHNFIRQIKREEDRYLFIGFYDDYETIFVNICVT